MAKKKISFEESMEQLEEIIYKLESGNVSLEESIELYKKGSELAEKCRQKLMDAEGEILLLKKKLGDTGCEEIKVTEEFGEDSDK